jgi:hypothetical protein|tara:strand:+ start:4959 stop:5573 length:615 start_codon:yes stop_codon:yes gene_type:complete
MAIVTPKGTAMWAKLFTPDFKFSDVGEYSVALTLGADQATDIVSKIDAQLNVSLEKAQKENPTKKGSIKPANPPYKEVYDEQGNATGDIEFKFKQKAVVQTKNGPLKKKPAVVDAKGKPIREPIEVGNGSVMKVAFDMYPYYTAMAGAGVSLKLTAAQLIDVKGSFKFDVEDGYEFSESDVKQNDEDFTNEEETPRQTDDTGDF